MLLIFGHISILTLKLFLGQMLILMFVLYLKFVFTVNRKDNGQTGF